MKIAIGADHRGYTLKQELQRLMSEITWNDCGTYSTEVTDYPIYAHSVVEAVHKGNGAVQGILLCGTGVGMSIAANRYSGIYAALVWNEEIARRAKEEDHANILVLPSDYVDIDAALTMINAWLTAQSKPGRYEKRISMIDLYK